MNIKFSLVLHNCKFGDEKQRSFDMDNSKPNGTLIKQLVIHFNAEHATIEERYVPKKNTGGLYINSGTINVKNFNPNSITTI